MLHLIAYPANLRLFCAWGQTPEGNAYMPRASKDETIDQLIRGAVDRVVERVFAAIETQMNRAVAARVAAELKHGSRGSRGRRNGAPKARARVELTTWVADRRARRVPNFVIEATGLDTKKRIVEKFGEAAKFEKGKGLPKARAAGHDGGSGEATTKAKPPVIRKAAAAAK
jgi:hypothetical protein